MARSGHTSVRSLARYARVSARGARPPLGRARPGPAPVTLLTCLDYKLGTKAQAGRDPRRAELPEAMRRAPMAGADCRRSC
jgi:hypothetical protein